MKFHATNEQMKAVMAAAVNASIPIGLGTLHYKNRKYSPSDFSVDEGVKKVCLDYVDGRMVKFLAYRVDWGSDQWESERKAHREYQSWVDTYASYADLVESVLGVEAIIEL
jgi:hypothetical protein